MQVGDIVTLWSAGERKVIVGVDRWFSEQDIEIFSPRKP